MKLFWVSSLCMSPGIGSYILPATQLRGGEGGERHGETVHVQMLNGHRLKELLVIFKSKSTYDVKGKMAASTNSHHFYVFSMDSVCFYQHTSICGEMYVHSNQCTSTIYVIFSPTDSHSQCVTDCVSPHSPWCKTCSSKDHSVRSDP